MIEFSQPLSLLLLPLAAFLLAYSLQKSLAAWSRPKKIVCFSLRLIMLFLLILALAGIRWSIASRETAVVFLKDVSASIPGPEGARAEEFIHQTISEATFPYAILEFGGSQAILRGFDGAQPSKNQPVDKNRSDLSAAVNFATGLFPTDKARRIVLLSDGIDTENKSAATIIAGLAGQGIECDLLKLDAAKSEEAGISTLEVPEMIRERIPFDLLVQVQSTATISAMVRLYKDNLLQADKRVLLQPGGNTVTFPDISATGRTAVFEAELIPERDTHPENNRLKRIAPINGPLRVLLVDAEPDKSSALAEALEQSGLNVEVRPADRFPESLTDLHAFDLLVFNNVPASSISDRQAGDLKTWVHDFGGGFLMIGGENSFSSGGYFKTTIESLLPVTMDHDDRMERPVAALLVVLDCSGSMSTQTSGQTKISLANEGAALALDVLQSSDFFGVDAVDTRVQHIVPLAKASDKPLLSKRIMGITAGGGGIYIYTALAEALRQLRETPAKLKHVILFSDAADIEDKYSEGDSGLPVLDLAAAMLANHITVSIVALGNESDRDTGFLRTLATQGGGRFYLTSDASTLPRIFTAETLRATQPGLVEDAFQAKRIQPSGAVSGIDWQKSPVLLGYNATRLKPTATLVLATERKDPLLATWRHGLGQTAAFTSDAKPLWAAEWMAWPGFGKFWAQLAATVSRSSEMQALSATVEEKQTFLKVDIEALAANGAPRNGLTLTVNVAPESGEPLTLTASQTGPGRYRVEIPTLANSMLIAISEQGSSARPLLQAWTRSYPAEFFLRENDAYLLNDAVAETQGILNPKPDQIFRPFHQNIHVSHGFSDFLLLTALLLFPLDVWLRRREWSSEKRKALPQFSQGN